MTSNLKSLAASILSLFLSLQVSGMNEESLANASAQESSMLHVTELNAMPAIVGQIFNVQVLGRGGVPSSGVSAVAVNVTVTDPSQASHLTVFPKGEAPPNASNLNFTAGQTVPNMVVAKVGADGSVSIRVDQGASHVIVDVAGWFADGGSFQSVSPARLADSRVGQATVDGLFRGVGRVSAQLNFLRYKQADARWNGTRIGIATMGWTACVPAAFATVLSGYGINQSPLQVAQLMHQAGDYNRTIPGASAYSIAVASAHFGLQGAPITSEAALVEALRNNQPVIAQVEGPTSITAPGTTHAVVLSGFVNGQTLVLNPGRFGDGWFSVSELWSKRSTFWFDAYAGGVFWSVR